MPAEGIFFFICLYEALKQTWVDTEVTKLKLRRKLPLVGEPGGSPRPYSISP
jgi:hypothetical protein